MIRQVNFDFDGVLVDACDIHYKALNRALPTPISYEEHIARFNGLPTKKKLAMLLNEGRIDQKDLYKINISKQLYTEEEFAKLSVDWSKIRLMQRLYEDDIRICCVSNAINKTVRLGLEKIGILEYFDFIVSNDSWSEPKPSPQPYLYASTQFGYSKNQNLIIEDSPVGIQSAQSGGFKHILKVNNATEVTADTVLRKIREINEICL